MDADRFALAHEISKQLGFPDEVIHDISMLLEHIKFSVMTAEEQAIYMLELGRITAERYTQKVSLYRGASLAPSYSQVVGEICQALCGGGGK